MTPSIAKPVRLVIARPPSAYRDSRLATGALATAFAGLGLSTSAVAQTRQLGARALVLDDNATHKITIKYNSPVSGTYTLPAPDQHGIMNNDGTGLLSTLLPGAANNIIGSNRTDWTG